MRRPYLTEDRDVFDVIIVGQRFDESVAEARLAHPRLAALLFRSGYADYGHIEGPHWFRFSGHLRCDALVFSCQENKRVSSSGRITG